MLLGAAQYLAETRRFDGTVVLIFQPAEENEGGGRVMVQEGLFERFPVQAVYGLHNWPGLAEGRFAVRPGPMMAGCDQFEIELSGRGCHAAMAEEGIDPIVAGSALVQALQTITSRNIAAADAAATGSRMDHDAMEDLGGVDVAHTHDDCGVHDHQLDGGLAIRTGTGQPPGRESVAKRLRPQASKELVTHGVALQPQHQPEAPGVVKTKLPAGVHQDTQVVMFFPWLRRPGNPQAARHAEMNQHGRSILDRQ